MTTPLSQSPFRIPAPAPAAREVPPVLARPATSRRKQVAELRALLHATAALDFAARKDGHCSATTVSPFPLP